MHSKKIKRPLFIVFEGIDGSGKSTQAEKMLEYLRDQQVPCAGMMEPTSGKWGRQIREMLKGETAPHPDEQLRLFLLDREEDVSHNIMPALERGDTVVMDRYYYSNAAYQGASGLSTEYILQENRARKFPEPDRIYYIDLSPEKAIDRITMRNEGRGTEIFEKTPFLHKVRENYLSFRSERFVQIDGDLSADDVFSAVRDDFTANFTDRS